MKRKYIRELCKWYQTGYKHQFNTESFLAINLCTWVKFFSVFTEAMKLEVNWQKFRVLSACRLRLASVRDRLTTVITKLLCIVHCSKVFPGSWEKRLP